MLNKVFKPWEKICNVSVRKQNGVHTLSQYTYMFHQGMLGSIRTIKTTIKMLQMPLINRSAA